MSEQVLLLSWLPECALPRLVAQFSQVHFLDARDVAVVQEHLQRATISYGMPALDKLAQAGQLRWIQLTSAGVPQDLCTIAEQRSINITNLAGLYASSIAEHALALMV